MYYGIQTFKLTMRVLEDLPGEVLGGRGGGALALFVRLCVRVSVGHVPV